MTDIRLARPRPIKRPRLIGEMNRTEREYSFILESRKRAGEIVDYRFEAITLKLANNTRYTPDFYVLFEDRIELHEVKGGFWRDDARVKIKVAAAMFPEFAFIAALNKKKQWIFVEF